MMNLVGYSDSESDSEPEIPAPKPASKATTKKLVNPGTHKVSVSLPALEPETDDIQKEAPSAKRAKIGGGLNINAFLPAPKRPAGALAKGANLKTGAEAAFSRTPKTFEAEGVKKDIKDVIAELRARPSQAVAEDVELGGEKLELPAPAQKEVKLVGNAMRFKPLSVSKNAQKKKKKLPPPTAASSNPAAKSAQVTPETAQAPAPAKAKVSLFSIGKDQLPPLKGAGYDFFGDEEEDEDEETTSAPVEEQSYEPAFTPQPGAQNLNAITKDMNLTDADMRQLFGRQAGKGGKMPDLSNMKVVNFNMDDEYKANNELIAKGEVITHNPVRAIAPGKHSLKQLVNAAATQKAALEEHFAKGRANQREASSRYGWS